MVLLDCSLSWLSIVKDVFNVFISQRIINIHNEFVQEVERRTVKDDDEGKFLCIKLCIYLYMRMHKIFLFYFVDVFKLVEVIYFEF